MKKKKRSMYWLPKTYLVGNRINTNDKFFNQLNDGPKYFFKAIIFRTKNEYQIGSV